VAGFKNNRSRTNIITRTELNAQKPKGTVFTVNQIDVSVIFA